MSRTLSVYKLFKHHAGPGASNIRHSQLITTQELLK